MVATRKQTEQRDKSPARGKSNKRVQINEAANTAESNTSNPVVINAKNVNVNSASQQSQGYIAGWEEANVFGFGWKTAGGVLGLTTGAVFNDARWALGSAAFGALVHGNVAKYAPRAVYNVVAYGPGYAKQALETARAYMPSRETVSNGATKAKDAAVCVLTFAYGKLPSIRKGAKPAEVTQTEELTTKEVVAKVAAEIAANEKTTESKKPARNRKAPRR